jgi:hypothetical protein
MTFETDRLVVVTAAIDSIDFDTAIAQLITKYGAPSWRRLRRTRDESGVVLPQTQVVWHAADGSMVVAFNPSADARRATISIAAPEPRTPGKRPKPDV